MDTIEERVAYWERKAKEAQQSADYYQQQLVDAHAMIGRITMQLSERWDSVRLTKYYPTDNLHGRRRVGNPTGEKA